MATCRNPSEKHVRTDASGDGRFPATLLVIEFSATCSETAVNFLIEKLEAPHDEVSTGGGMLVKAVRDGKTRKLHWLHVSADLFRLLEAAEWHELQRPDYKDGLMREFTMEALASFAGTTDDEEALSALLNDAEKCRLVEAEITRIRAQGSDVEALFESDKCRLQPGQSIIQRMVKSGLIKQMFPLHDKEQRRKLYGSWVDNLFARQPLHDIRNYFGEQIAMYFAFLGFYTYCLLFPAAIGVILYFANWEYGVSSMVLFALCNIIFATMMLEYWKRNAGMLAYQWGTLRQRSMMEGPRVGFKGKMSPNPVTGKMEPVYPRIDRLITIFFISVPVVIGTTTFAFWLMLQYFSWSHWADVRYKSRKHMFNYVIAQTPVAVYSVIVSLMNLSYIRVAKWLNNKENWRLQSEYDNQLALKLLIFNFINNFAGLFYVAFYLQDFELVRKTLFTLVATTSIINQLRELLTSYLQSKFRVYVQEFDELRAKRKVAADIDAEDAERDPAFYEQHERAVYEAKKVPYTRTFDDLSKVYVQFGYVFMFSSSFTLAAAFAAAVNFFEMRTDAYKLCKIHQRPFAAPSQGLGVWQWALEFLGIIAVMTNCAVIALSPPVREAFPDLSSTQLLLALVIVEHILIGVKFFVAYLIPDVPESVAINIARVGYQSKEALNRIRASRSMSRLQSVRDMAGKTPMAKQAAQELTNNNTQQPPAAAGSKTTRFMFDSKPQFS